MPKAFVAVVLLILSFALLTFFFLKPSQTGTTISTPIPNPPSTPETIQSKKNIDVMASFIIFTNGTFRIFTDSRYHNKSEEVFIEAENPNTIRVKKIGITYKDFFSTLPMKLEKDCLTTGTGQVFCNSETHSLKFYLNGQNEIDLLDREITDNDQLLISYGPINEDISYQLQKIPQP